jgi:formiminotetrahydrofolate cyclodeaminase
MFADLTIKEFLDKVASGEPVPGGGSVAALAGALSAALSRMVGGLTLGRSDDHARDERMSALMERTSLLQTRLVETIDSDSEAYAGVLDAYRMAKGTEEEKGLRREAVQDALKGATLVPLAMAEMGLELLSLSGTAVREGNRNAVTDGLVAALMARAAVMGALFNVRINLVSIKDGGFSAEIAEKAGRIEKEAVHEERALLDFAAALIERGV